jgi:hypothetical protein
MNRQVGLIDNRSSPEDEIVLFRSIFRGRDDVYPRRFVSRRTGKAGLSARLRHLDDAEAYRRDRRKDLLLQENGYLVLRFLAEDVGKRLDAVLDAILRAMAHRRKP